MVNFAKRLMLYFFDETELAQCDSLYGKQRFSSDFAKQSLDPYRVGLIRQIVEENATPSKTLWNECINTLNAELRKIKLRQA